LNPAGQQAVAITAKRLASLVDQVLGEENRHIIRQRGWGA